LSETKISFQKKRHFAQVNGEHLSSSEVLDERCSY